MKPKNRTYCHLAKKAKMTFTEEKEALRFLEFNTGDPERWGGGKMPVRAYYCVPCGGWHVTSSRTPMTTGEEDIKGQEKILDRVIQEAKKPKAPSTSPDPCTGIRKRAKEFSAELAELERSFGALKKCDVSVLPVLKEKALQVLPKWNEIRGEAELRQEVLESRKMVNLEKRVKSFVGKLYNAYLEMEIGIVRNKLLETETLLNYGLPELASENYIEAAKLYYDLVQREKPENLKGLGHDFEVMKKKIDISIGYEKEK